MLNNEQGMMNTEGDFRRHSTLFVRRSSFKARE